MTDACSPVSFVPYGGRVRGGSTTGVRVRRPLQKLRSSTGARRCSHLRPRRWRRGSWGGTARALPSPAYLPAAAAARHGDRCPDTELTPRFGPLLDPSVGINSVVSNDHSLRFFWLVSVDERTRLDIAQQSYNVGDFRVALEQSNAIYRENPRLLENLLLLGAVYFQVFFQ